jgi:hypothetical protein
MIPSHNQHPVLAQKYQIIYNSTCSCFQNRMSGRIASLFKQFFKRAVIRGGLAPCTDSKRDLPLAAWGKTGIPDTNVQRNCRADIPSRLNACDSLWAVLFFPRKKVRPELISITALRCPLILKASFKLIDIFFFAFVDKHGRIPGHIIFHSNILLVLYPLLS